MLIVGAKGFAKEVFEIIYQLKDIDNLVFFDDISSNIQEKMFDSFPILNSDKEVIDYFRKVDKRFTIGIGNPLLRNKMFKKFKNLGGELSSVISVKSSIGSFDCKIGHGCNILGGATISNGASLGVACIVYYNSIITHDCKIGDFVEISPGATLLGRCSIGSYSQIGANVTILPDIKIGKNVIIGAGSIVTKNVDDNCLIYGSPAVFKKKLMTLTL